MKIGIVTPIWPSRNNPTQGRFIYETVSALARQVPVHVYVTRARYIYKLSAADTDLPFEVADHLGQPVPIDIVHYPALPGLTRHVNDRLACRALRRHIHPHDVDALIGYWVFPEGAAAMALARRWNKPGILGALGTDINERRGLAARLTGRAMQQADRVIFVSQDMLDKAVRDYGLPLERCVKVINGINTAVFRPQDRDACREALSIASSVPMVVYVGRLIEAKGLSELIQATQQLTQRLPDIQVHIIGTGEWKAQLESQINATGLARHVHLAGGRQPAEIACYINAADVLCLPSWTEGYPNVLVEALACGCPVVATRVGGIPEIVGADNGLMVPPRQPDALAEALASALTRPWPRPAIAKAMSRTWDDVARETLHVCETVLAQHARDGRSAPPRSRG